MEPSLALLSTPQGSTYSQVLRMMPSLSTSLISYSFLSLFPLLNVQQQSLDNSSSSASPSLKLLLRGRGHTSFVSGVAFDEFHCTDECLRFGSVTSHLSPNLWGPSHCIRSERMDISLCGSIVLMKLRIRHYRVTIHFVIRKFGIVFFEYFCFLFNFCSSQEPCAKLAFISTGVVTVSWLNTVKYWYITRGSNYVENQSH